MTLLAFTPTGGFAMDASDVSSSQAIPLTGSPTTMIISNLSGVEPIFVALGVGSAVATINSYCIMPGWSSAPIAIGSNTWVAVITPSAGKNAPVHIDVGT